MSSNSATNSLIQLLFLTFAVLHCSRGDKWLMDGDFVSERSLRTRNLDVETKNSSTSTSTSMEITLTTRQGRKINCIIAAAIFMNGDVNIVKGGVNYENVTVSYNSLNEKPDTFFVLVQSYADRDLEAVAETEEILDEVVESYENNDKDLILLKDNAASNSKVTILYDQLRLWIKDNNTVTAPTVKRPEDP